MSPAICGAITGLTLPISSRMASSLRNARMMSSLWPPSVSCPGVAAVHGVPNQNLVLLLPVTVDSAVALFHNVGVVGNLDMN